MTQPEKFKQYDASLAKHPNHSFIQLFFSKPNDILRFPLFFEDNPQRLEAIRGRGGLADFSPEALKQLQDIFHTLRSGDYSRYSPERITYLDFLKNNTLHALKEYTAEYDRLENDLFRENNRIFATEYFSRLSEITRQVGYVNGYLTMFSFSLAGYRKIEELENTIRELKRQAARIPELEAAIRNLESLLEAEKERNQALQNALAAQYGMKPCLTLAEKVAIINDCFKELGLLYKKDSYTGRTIQNWDNGKCPYNGYSSLYNAVELKAWCFKVIQDIRCKEQITKPVRGLSEEEMSRRMKKR
ncbi:MAG: hypothetical protein HPZ91_09555 [Lentisphaeria bacterium]|nr:hypothetical protein [Lentisphaeria bacterium]